MEQINKEIKGINLKLAQQEKESFQELLLFVVRGLIIVTRRECKTAKLGAAGRIE